MRVRPALALLLTVMVSLGFTVDAGAAKPADLERVREEIRRLKSRLFEVQNKARSAESELQKADLALAIRSSELQMASDVRTLLENRTTQLEGQIRGLTTRATSQREYLKQRLSILYKLGNLSYFRLLVSIRSDRNPLEAITLLRYVIQRDSRAIDQFEVSLRDLAVRRTELEEQRGRASRAAYLVLERRRELEKSRVEKAQLLVRLQSESVAGTAKLAELQEREKRLERLFQQLYQRNDPKVSPKEGISALKKLLAWPVSGKIVRRFGRQRDPQFATFTVNNGVRIAATPGVEVRSIHQGTVLFAQWFKGYGNLLILDHGNRIFSLYGNLRNTQLPVGTKIEAGQVIAAVAEGDDGSGYLYFEIREDNQPVDPTQWLKTGTGK